MRRLFLLLALSSSGLACGGTVAPTDAALDRAITPDAVIADSPSTSITLGTGQTQWEPLLPSGNRMELIHGPQGGYHVFGRVRYRGLGPDVLLSFRVTPAEGGPAINDPASRIRLREARGLVRVGEDTWETSSAQLVILEGIRGPQEVVGRRFRLEMLVQRYEAADALAGAIEAEIIDET